jgi:hypothetical protein
MASLKRTGSILFFALLTGTTAFLYQNCAKMEPGARSLASETFNFSLGNFPLGSKVDGDVSCSFNGVILNAGESVEAFQNSSVASGTTCLSEVRTCKNNRLTGSFNYATCAVGHPKSCLFNGRTIASGESVTAYLNSSANAGATCESQNRTCNDGVLSGSFAYGACAVEAPKSCLFNGRTILSGQSVSAFASSSVAADQNCTSELRTCTNGVLSGSNSFASCEASKPASCLFNGQTIASGQDITGFYTSRVPFGSTCLRTERTCTNGAFSGDGSALFASCAVDEAASCLFNGQTIVSGQKVIAFAATSVPFGQTCVTEERSCTNGQLSGSYTAATCIVEEKEGSPTDPPNPSPTPTPTPVPVPPPPGIEDSEPSTTPSPGSCSYGFMYIRNGISLTAYKSSLVAYGQACESQVRTCTNGVLSGTFEASYCTVAAESDCVFNGRLVSNGSSVRTYIASSVPYGDKCEYQDRLCTSGVLSGSYTSTSCTTLPPASCTFDGKTIPHGARVTAYQSASVPAGQRCVSENRLCLNGTLTGSFVNSTCAVLAP